MARVAALIPDLLFGSKVQSALEGAGHEVDLITGELEAWDEVGGIDLLVVDLTSPDVDGVELFETLATAGELNSVRSLGFFAHVEPEVRKRALQAGFDLVVPRSRMAREGALLVEGLLADDGG
jgi:CheY-like chemotaxis protein